MTGRDFFTNGHNDKSILYYEQWRYFLITGQNYHDNRSNFITNDQDFYDDV